MVLQQDIIVQLQVQGVPIASSGWAGEPPVQCGAAACDWSEQCPAPRCYWLEAAAGQGTGLQRRSSGGSQHLVSI